MAKIKRLFAIHSDHEGKSYRTKIAEGTTGDFAHPLGFVIEDIYDENDPTAPDTKVAGQENLGLNGTYPALLSGEHRMLEGKLLTLCDMTFTNKEQREAFKSVIRETLWNSFSKQVDSIENTFQYTQPNKQ